LIESNDASASSGFTAKYQSAKSMVSHKSNARTAEYRLREQSASHQRELTWGLLQEGFRRQAFSP
jgi:hypothetical protein